MDAYYYYYYYYSIYRAAARDNRNNMVENEIMSRITFHKNR